MYTACINTQHFHLLDQTHTQRISIPNSHPCTTSLLSTPTPPLTSRNSRNLHPRTSEGTPRVLVVRTDWKDAAMPLALELYKIPEDRESSEADGVQVAWPRSVHTIATASHLIYVSAGARVHSIGIKVSRYLWSWHSIPQGDHTLASRPRYPTHQHASSRLSSHRRSVLFTPPVAARSSYPQ
jgi:hypothetical protein